MDRHDAGEQLWPTDDYYRQIKQLQQAVGSQVFLAELKDSASNGSVFFSSEPLTLLQVIDYPQPDPYRQLCPHMLILDDGRGINLGRIVRISRNTAFGPKQQDVLFQNTEFFSEVLLAPRVLSQQSIANTSKAIFRQMFGDKPGQLLRNDHADQKVLNQKKT